MNRTRKFNPKNFFLSVLQLASSANGGGYTQALIKTWQDTGEPLECTPAKSSFSEARAKVSFEFFKEIYQKDLSRLEPHRKRLRGFHVYAIDGDQFELPASQSVLEEGFRGYPTMNNQETHYPKMYTVQLVDLLNGLIKDFRYSTKQDETHMARSIVETLEKNSITIYDSLHVAYATFYAHATAENYFIVRARTEGMAIPKVVREFLASEKRSIEVSWPALYGLRDDLPALTVRIVKIKNPRTKKDLVLITNLPRNLFCKKQLGILYQRRWGIETSFRDLTHTLKLGKWHSMTLNGILQEIYSLLWLVNCVRMQIGKIIKESRSFFDDQYSKANFKLCFSIVVEHMKMLIASKIKEVIDLLNYGALRTIEKENICLAVILELYDIEVKNTAKLMPFLVDP